MSWKKDGVFMIFAIEMLVIASREPLQCSPCATLTFISDAIRTASTDILSMSKSLRKYSTCILF